MTIIARKMSSVAPDLVQSAISHHDRKKTKFVAQVDIFRGMMTVSYPSPLEEQHKRFGGAGRGQVTEFSRRSQRRMMDKMQQLEKPTRLLFVTLTYTDQSLDPETISRSYHRDLDCINKRLQHEYPGTGHIWRIEYKNRLSGCYEGHTVPHFHLVLNGCLADLAVLRKQVRTWWNAIIHDNTTNAPVPRIEISPARSQRHALYYISKYVGKVSEQNNIADEHQHNYSEGHRHWGIVGNWDTPIYCTIKLTRQEFIDLRRLCIRYLKSKNCTYAKGLAKSRSYQGYSIFGLGNEAISTDKTKTATIFQMLRFVTDQYDP